MNRHLLEINLAMLFISTSGPIGRYVTLLPATSIWIRGLLAAIIMISFCLFRKYSFKIHSKVDFIRIIISGMCLGAHWVLYFYSLQYTNVAIAILVLFTYPLFTSILEPVFYKTKWSTFQVLASVMILLGLYVLMPASDEGNNHFIGIMLGLGSSFFYTLRNLIIKPQAATYNGSMIMTYQLIVVSVILIPLQLDLQVADVQRYFIHLIILALVTTAMGHTLFLRSFKHFDISIASILSSLQPVYGIILAFFFLREVPELRSILGGILILGTVVLSSWIIKNREAKT